MTASPLISVDELRDAARASVTVLDVRYRMGGPPAGRTSTPPGTSPGRRTSTWTPRSPLHRAPAGGTRCPSRRFRGRDAAAGVSDGRPVVVYDDWDGRAAARAWWLLRFHGHPDVRVLDGGWPAWRTAGGGVESGHGGVRSRATSRRSPAACRVVEADGVLDVGVLVDARAAERYRGEIEPIDPVAGPHPGRGQRADRPRTSVRTAGSARPTSCGRRTPRSARVAGRRRGGVLRLRRHRRPRRAGDGGGRDDAPRSTRAAGAAGSPTRTGPWRTADRPSLKGSIGHEPQVFCGLLAVGDHAAAPATSARP